MSEKEEENIDNIYVYNEENDQDPDNSPMNYASSYNIENDEEEEIESGEATAKQSSAFMTMLRVMFSPVEGWKRVRREKMKPETLQRGCFYPLLALLAISKFADMFYYVNVTLTTVFSQAVVLFVSYFFGYFGILFLLTLLLPAPVKEYFDKDFGKDYIIIALSTLAMFSILINALPMLWPVLIFLPIWTLYILYKGSRFFKLAEPHVLRFMLLVCVSVVGVPLLIEWGLNELMPY